MTEHAFRVKQDGIVVAAVHAPTFHGGLKEISRYASQYEQDGPISIEHKAPGGRWVKS